MRIETDIWLPTSLDEVESAPAEEKWKFDLKWEKGSKGTIKLAGTIDNICQILENDPIFKEKIRFNEFSNEIDVREVQWQETVKAWSDSSDAYLALYL
ncbi:MAG: hypothetical protein HUJ98_11845 [Bacteroidaceae bacterium]|nr:hypothetical protein [Bacteroidaceae bacterium]